MINSELQEVCLSVKFYTSIDLEDGSPVSMVVGEMNEGIDELQWWVL